MRPAIVGRGIEQEHRMVQRLAIAGSELEQLPLDIQADQRSRPCERIGDREAHAFAGAASGMQDGMFPAFEPKEGSVGLADDQRELRKVTHRMATGSARCRPCADLLPSRTGYRHTVPGAPVGQTSQG